MLGDSVREIVAEYRRVRRGRVAPAAAASYRAAHDGGRDPAGLWGVTLDPRWPTPRWQARLGRAHGRRHLGMFDTAEAAARAYDRAARAAGERVKLNFSGEA